MTDLVELFKLVISNPSSSIVVLAVCGFLIFKVQDLLQIYFDVKDLNKKRLMQKFEETYTFHEKNFLSTNLKVNYERLCEEAQLKALIGCQYCSKEMAQYILSRKDITRAIRIYHRIKDEIKIKNGIVVPNFIMPSWRIKLNTYAGIVFYVLIILLGASPLLLVALANILKIKADFDGQYYLNGFLFLSAFVIPAIFTLVQSFKPEFAQRFCELESQFKNELESEIVEIEDKVA